jgi:hypothetical protein
MNEKDKKPTHYTTGENGDAVPVYPETADNTNETVEPKTDSVPLYYITEPSGEVKPVGVNQEFENEAQEENEPEKISVYDISETVDLAENTAEETTDNSEISEAEEKLNEDKTDSAEITRPEEEAVVNTEVIEDSTKDEVSEEIIQNKTESESAINELATDSTKDETSVETGSVETEEAASTETEKVVEAATPEQSTETSRAEDSNKPTEEDLQKVDLKLDQNQEDPNQEQQEVKAASKLINETAKEKGSKKKKGLAAALAGALAVVGIGVGYASTGGSDSSEATQAPSSSSAEANPGNSTEQASNVLSGITVDGTLKEFDTKEQTNVITLQDAKDFSSDTTNTPATQSANEQDPDSPVADYNVKIFDIMLNGSPDEIRELLKNLGLGPQELKDRYDRAIELGTYNEWGDMSEQAYSHKGWPMGQGMIYGNIDTLNPGIMYNRVWAIAIANAVEVTGGDIPPAQPRDAATLAKNRELIESWFGEEGRWTLYFATDDTLKTSDQPGEVLTGPPNTQFTNPDDLMVVYIDPNNKDTLILSDSIPTEKLTNIAYTNIYPMPANIGEIIPYGYAGPTSISKFVQNSTS